jgi:hypothetical protein
VHLNSRDYSGLQNQEMFALIEFRFSGFESAGVSIPIDLPAPDA